MAGIAGILVPSSDENSDFLLQKMSETIRHRKCSTYHTLNRNDFRCLIVGGPAMEGPDDEIFILDKNPDLDFAEETDDVTSILEIFGAVTAIIDDQGVNLIRTLDGTRALYYGIKDDIFVFSSERKALWAIDIKQTEVLEPGQGLTRTWDGQQKVERFATLEKPPITQVSREEILEALRSTLEASFEQLRRNAKCAVLFSGGVDSSLAAVLSAKRSEDIILVTTRTEKSHDKTAAANAAAQLGLPLYTVELSSEIVWKTLPELIYTIETSNQMDVEIALPFYLAAKKAAEEGCTTIISGQGPDELFAGYAKHVKTFSEGGTRALEEQLWQEVSITHEANIDRDAKAIAAHGVESFFPYLDQLFVRTALSIPAVWKVNPDMEPQRKVIFRELAQSMGVPKDVALTPKSATQYSSGSAKLILTSIMENVEDFGALSKKRAARRVQGVLDAIASEKLPV